MDYWQKSNDAFKAFGCAVANAGSGFDQLNAFAKLHAAMIDDFFDLVTTVKRERIKSKLSGWMPERWAAFIAERIPERWIGYINV